LGAVAIAQALLLTINPRDVPAFETQTPMLEGNSSIKSGRVTIEKTRREFRDFPTAGSPSRGRTSRLDIVLPGFYPAVYP
jgi:hypothetical protein